MKFQWGNIKKYLNTTTLIIGLVVALSISILIGMKINSRLTEASYHIQSLEMLKSALTKERQRLDSLIGFYQYSITLRDTIIAQKGREISRQISRIVVLENNFKKIQSDIDKITADSSYNYLNTIMPKQSEQKYGFDSIQVKTIHRTFLERDELRNINLEYSFATGNLLTAIHLRDAQIQDLRSLNDAYISKEAIMRKDQEFDKETIDGLNKSLKQQKRQKNWIIGGAAGAATIIIIKSIAK